MLTFNRDLSSSAFVNRIRPPPTLNWRDVTQPDARIATAWDDGSREPDPARQMVQSSIIMHPVVHRVFPKDLVDRVRRLRDEIRHGWIAARTVPQQIGLLWAGRKFDERHARFYKELENTPADKLSDLVLKSREWK